MTTPANTAAAAEVQKERSMLLQKEMIGGHYEALAAVGATQFDPTDVSGPGKVILFTSTIDEQFAGPTAEMAKGRATKMANAMRRLLTGRHGASAEPIEPMWTTDAVGSPPGFMR